MFCCVQYTVHISQSCQYSHLFLFKHILFRRKGLGATYNVTVPSPVSYFNTIAILHLSLERILQSTVLNIQNETVLI